MKSKTRRSGLFLIEILISILFFTVAAAVCIQIFVAAHLTEKHSTELFQSMKASENIYARIVSGDFSSGEQYLSSDFAVCDKKDASYVAAYTVTPEALHEICISVKDTNGQELYTLKTSYYSPSSGKDGGARE